MARALVAFPLQLVAVVRAVSDLSAGSADRTSARAPEPGHASGVGQTSIGLPVALVASVAALVLVFSLARALYYPFWAAGATPEELDRSWGGPSAVGATLVHWLVAAAVIVATYLVILVVERRADEPR